MNHKALAEMTDTAVHPVTIVEDGMLSNAAISLLCRIQHFNDQIDHPLTSDKRIAAIEVACEILIEIIQFSQSMGLEETRDEKDVLTNLVDRKKLVAAMLKKQSWSEMIGLDPDRSRVKDQEYAQLGFRFEDLFSKRLSKLDALVADPEHAREWHEHWSEVVTEFSNRW